MGNFRIEIEAIGGHGDRREGEGAVRDGESLDGWEDTPTTSVDRVAFEAVEALKARGAQIVSAELIHWPGTESEVTDDIDGNQRHGSF